MGRPLSFDFIIERSFENVKKGGSGLWDLERSKLQDPFGGLMTVPYTAIKMNRKGYGIELNADYFRDGVGYLKSVEEQYDAPTLFDFVS